MSIRRTHPADTTLVLAVDRELPTGTRVTLERHLISCQACRSRLAAFEEAARDATRACRDGAGGADRLAAGAIRTRLQHRMTELDAEWNRSLLFRLRRGANLVPPFVRAGVSLALVVLAVWLVRSDVHVAGVAGPAQSASLPLGHFTPGATSDATAAELCSGPRPAPRVVSYVIKRQVLQHYRMEHVSPSEYELDYLITPELGGVPEASNLWPERYDSVWNARVKDDLEALLPRLVCDGALDLQTAQREIAGNWIAAYKKHFMTDRPLPGSSARADDDDEIVFEPAPEIPAPRAVLVSQMWPASSRTAHTVASGF